MSQSEPSWGTAAWFSKRYIDEGTSKPTAYFSYKSNGYQRLRHSRLIKILSKSSDLFINKPLLVDLGCATGCLSNQIGKAVEAKNIVAIDFSPELLDEGRKYFPDIEFKEGSLLDLPLVDGSADIISLVEVLYYVDKNKRIDALLECSRILKDKGILIFTANVSGEPYLSLNEIEALFAEAPFKIEKRYLERYWLPIYIGGFLLRLHNLSRSILFSDISMRGTGRIEKYASYLRNPLGRLFAKAGLIISTKLIASRLLVSVLAVINRVVLIGGVTHSIFLAVKK